jgi:hypothetical protein
LGRAKVSKNQSEGDGMKEYICKEVPTDNGDYLEIETELIRCEDCAHYAIFKNGANGFCRKRFIPSDSYEWCSKADPKDKKSETES